MIVQVNRAFKSYSFCHQKKGCRLCMIFSPTLLQGYTGASIPNFNINVPFFYCSFFFEGYLKAQVKEMKMVSGDNYGNYHPGLSGLTRALSHYRIFVAFTLKLAHPTMVGGNFQIYQAQITGKCILSQKIEYRYFYSCRIIQKLACEQKKKRNVKEAAIAQTGGMFHY